MDQVSVQADLINTNNVGTGKAVLANVSRALEDEKKLDKCGFPKLETYFAVGTPLATSGVEAFRRERLNYDKLPNIIDGCKKLVEQVKKEERNDLVIKINELSATEDYKIKIPSVGDHYISNIDTLGSLLDFTGAGSGCSKYLSKCPADLRAKNINHWLKNSNDVAKLRLRKGNAGAEMFAVVGKNYTALDVDKVATMFAEVCPSDARVEIMYDGVKSRIQALFHTDIKPEQGVVGEIFKAGSSVKTDDTGGGSLAGRAMAWRALCLNFTNMMTSSEIGRRKHIGKEKMLRLAVKGFINDTLERITPFTNAWKNARYENIIESAYALDVDDEPLSLNDTYNSMMNIFAGVIMSDLVPINGRKQDRIPLLMETWEKEPEPTRSGVVNTLTRFAHELEQNSPWDEDDIQDAATDILFSRKPLPFTSATRIMVE